ncbi:ANTAR domain-containing protein [Streptomyces adustus]|uniref:ANTAR domain-containing protein n=1 Tax=Streptomyces adustus TaxID=1609272 RepID=UPI00128CA2C6|nr:ANTAR domain-containing protein [Streptomyces adustus]
MSRIQLHNWLAEQVKGHEAERVQELQEEKAQLLEAMRAHAVVDQAIGVVLATKQLTPEQGWDVLREVSQRTDIKLHHVSELIINWARTGELCADIRTELERQLSQNPQPSQNDA